jgi:hypothetical protein
VRGVDAALLIRTPFFGFRNLPLRPPDRDVYLREVAAALDGRKEIGDGFVARVCAEVQRRLWHPPLNEQLPRRRA